MRKYFVFLIFLATVAFAGVLLSAWYFSHIGPPSQESEEVRFVITKGSSATKIAEDLKEAGLIKSALAFKVYTQLNDEAGKIPPGEFSVPKNLAIKELLLYLRKGPEELWVTIPEGLRREEVVERVISQLMLSASDAAIFRQEFMALTKTEEGYLFPDTYLFPKEVVASQVVNLLLSTFDKKFSYEDGGELSREEAVVLASILERETLTDSERPIVAGVLLNRISNGWPLQADATAQYALGTIRCAGKIDCDWWVPPTRADLEISSPFNTYVINGLPPAPISNPGLSSLNAAANPKQTDFMFYIHDKEGKIHFAESLEEHNQNVEKYLR